jgi:hypothetical protein
VSGDEIKKLGCVKKRVEMGNDNEKCNQQVFRIISEKEKKLTNIKRHFKKH